MMNDKDLQVVEIDLTAAQKGEVTESWLGMFGANVKWLMRSMFGSNTAVPVKVKGNKSQISDFAKALGGEKKYIKTAAKYGLDDPRAYKDKFSLRKKIRKFESSTGLKWPFK
jgi:hypothetical protein